MQKNTVPLLLVAAALASGCRGLQSELQKSQLRKAGPTAVIEGMKVTLSSTLTRSTAQKVFDLQGILVIAADGGTFPATARPYHLALRPAAAGYYVMNFRNVGGNWKPVNPLEFSGTTRNETNSVIIEFTWKNRGGGSRSRSEADRAFDVSVSFADSQDERHILTTLSVPVTEQPEQR
jgi:hypothetical protein